MYDTFVCCSYVSPAPFVEPTSLFLSGTGRVVVSLTMAGPPDCSRNRRFISCSTSFALFLQNQVTANVFEVDLANGKSKTFNVSLLKPHYSPSNGTTLEFTVFFCRGSPTAKA